MEKDKNVIKMLRKSPLHNEAKRLVKEAHENYLNTLREYGKNSERTKNAYDSWVASIDYRLAVYKMVVKQIRADADNASNKEKNERIAKEIYERELVKYGDSEWSFITYQCEDRLLIVFLLSGRYHSHYTSYEDVIKEFIEDLEDYYCRGELPLSKEEKEYLGFN